MLQSALLLCFVVLAAGQGFGFPRPYPPQNFIQTTLYNDQYCNTTISSISVRIPGCYSTGESYQLWVTGYGNEYAYAYNNAQCTGSVMGTNTYPLYVCRSYRNITDPRRAPVAAPNDTVTLQYATGSSGCAKGNLQFITIKVGTPCDRTATPTCPTDYYGPTVTMCGDAYNYFFDLNEGSVDGVDRPAYDFPNMPISSSSVQNCQHQCFLNSSCATWAADSCGSNCWLKTSPSIPTTAAACRSSGVIPRYYGPVQTGVDAPYNDLPNMPFPVNSVTECQANCFYNPSCNSWAANTCGNECWLKSTVISSSGTVSNDCRASGNIFRGVF